MFFGKRGASTVIANMLIILIVVVLVSAISLALVPVIKRSFAGFGNCLDAQNSLNFVKTRLTCYDLDDDLGGLTIKANKDGLKKFRVAFTDNLGTVTFFDVSEGDNPSGFGMFGFGIPGAVGSQQIQLPQALQQLNYIALSSGNAFVKAEISPVVKKGICPIDDVVELEPCAPHVNLGQLPFVEIFVSVSTSGAPSNS